MRNDPIELALAIHRWVLMQLSAKESELVMDPSVVPAYCAGAFWVGKGSKLFLMNNVGSLVEYGAKDGMKFLKATHGKMYEYDALLTLATAAVGTDEARGLVWRVLVGIDARVLDHLKYFNQRSSMAMQVDMFATIGRMEILDETVRVVFTHKPYEAPRATFNQAVVDDFREHFPAFEDFLKFLVATRFAPDRKRSYLWFHCDSDWGKNLLISMLANLGAATTLHVKEVEAVFEGKPVGLSPVDFKRSLALVFDEFKTVKSELKQLQNEIALSPKHQLRCTVEIFTKLFFSAEGVPSLAGDEGIEDQFANRFSLIRGKGRIDDRALFQRRGKGEYFANLLTYTAQRLNEMIAMVVALGPVKAALASEAVVESFYQDHRIDQYHQRFTETIPEMGADFLEWLQPIARLGELAPGVDRRVARQIENSINETEHGCFLKRPKAALDLWVDHTIAHQNKGMVSMAADRIFAAISDSGKGISKHWPDGKKGKQVRCVKLDVPPGWAGPVKTAGRGSGGRL